MSRPADTAVCLAHIQLPAYPNIARSALVSGAVTATVEIGDGGRLREVSFDGKVPNGELDWFVAEIRRSLTASAFAPTCDGEKVRLRFAFRVDSTLGRTASYDYPDLFTVTTDAPEIQVDK